MDLQKGCRPVSCQQSQHPPPLPRSKTPNISTRKHCPFHALLPERNPHPLASPTHIDQKQHAKRKKKTQGIGTRTKRTWMSRADQSFISTTPKMCSSACPPPPMDSPPWQRVRRKGEGRGRARPQPKQEQARQQCGCCSTTFHGKPTTGHRSAPRDSRAVPDRYDPPLTPSPQGKTNLGNVDRLAKVVSGANEERHLKLEIQKTTNNHTSERVSKCVSLGVCIVV